jgi:hypothetical protein
MAGKAGFRPVTTVSCGFFGILCYVVPVALHCAYDTFAGSISTPYFILIVILIYLIIFKLLKREAMSVIVLYKTFQITESFFSFLQHETGIIGLKKEFSMSEM